MNALRELNLATPVVPVSLDLASLDVVVIGAPPAIATDSFTTNSGQPYAVLRDICSTAHGRAIQAPGGPRSAEARS